MNQVFTPEDPDDNRPPVIVVAGPTAVGKTSLGIALALRFDGEVVNADSRYLYRGMDIGVAKPTLEERLGVPHHLIDIREPSDDMSLATYQDLAYTAIADIHIRGKLPLLVGGTPLYVNAVVEGWRMPRVPPHPEIRRRLEQEVDELGLAAVAEKLLRVDPVAFERSAQNARRVIRALEVLEVTGVPMSAQEGKGPRPYRALELGLTMSRERLRSAIDNRVDGQIAGGLVDEVRNLLDNGVTPDAPAMSSLGYRQLLPLFRGESSLDECIAQIKADTWRYVRHQETWLRRNPRLISLDVEQPGWRDDATGLVDTFLRGTGAPRAAWDGCRSSVTLG